MNTAIYVLAGAMMLAQPQNRGEWQLTPQLATGLELVYRGEFLEESLGQNFQRQTRYRIETNMFVLEAGVKDWQAAFITMLKLNDGREQLKPKGKADEGPSSLRLELGRVDLQGRIRDKDKRLMQLPLKGPPTLESGFLVGVPLTKVARNQVWEVPEEGRPLMRWQVVGTEPIGGVAHVKLVGLQQTEDWDRGRADHVAWRRRDTIWLHPQLNVAQRVERIIEQRDPAREQPTHRVTVRYELDNYLKYLANPFAERRDELFKAAEVYDLTQKLIKRPAEYRTQIDIQIQRIGLHLDRNPKASYGHVFAHLKSVLEHAMKGEAPVPHVAEDPRPIPAHGLGVGYRVPDFIVSALTQEQPTTFKAKHGRPTLVFFYNPETDIGKEAIRYAKRLSERKGPPVTILALAVTPDADIARKQHAEMRLTFPIHDGNGMRLSFGVTQTPRFVVIDGDGLVTFVQTGWGLCTPEELDEILERCQKKVAAN